MKLKLYNISEQPFVEINVTRIRFNGYGDVYVDTNTYFNVTLCTTVAERYILGCQVDEVFGLKPGTDFMGIIIDE